jgi:Putative beta-lactamase-inhibitor-like, PepSY-like
MKWINTILVLIVFANCSYPKKSDVPAVVLEAFTKKFPEARDVEWSKEGENEYEAEFKINNTAKASNFDGDGKWLLTESEIEPSGMPNAVQETILVEFVGFKISKAEKVETLGGEVFYEIQLLTEKEKLEVKISLEGDLKERKKGEIGEEDEED